MSEQDDAVARHVVRRIALSGGAVPCPDANLLVGFAEGTLEPTQEEVVTEHVAECATCREALDEVEVGAPREASTEGGPAERPGGRAWWTYAAAAVLLAAVGAGAVLLLGQGQEPRADTSARVAAAAGDLARARPDLFAGFVPLGPGDRPTGDERERGGVRLLAPSDRVLAPRPTFRWVAVPGVTRYDVTLESGDGGTLWTRAASGTALAYPDDVAALTPGTPYAWSVAFEGVVGGRTEGRRRFTTASSEEAQAFEEASRAIAARVDPDLRDLLLAQFALRRGLVAEAERLARAHLDRNAADDVGRATLRHVLLLQGSPEAPPSPGPGDRRR